jgi:hypothetical protein
MMWAVLPAMVVVVILLISYFHKSKVDRFLHTELKIDKSLKKKASKLYGLEVGAITSVSVADVLYNTARLDPFVLQGVNHLHHAQEFSNLGDLMGFLEDNIIKSQEGTAEWTRMIHKYKGYTGEQIVAENYELDGKEVNFPDSATTKGYDMTVDGIDVDVKTVSYPSSINQHLEQYPEIPIVGNREMNMRIDSDNFSIDDGLSVHDAFDSTNDTFASVADMGDMFGAIPIITVCTSGYRNIKGVKEGRKDVASALEHTALDTVGVGGGGFVGAKIGLIVGGVLAPVTGGVSAIVIPAATTLLGTIAGMLGGKKITSWWKERDLRKYMEQLREKATEYYNTFVERHEIVVRRYNEQYDQRISRTEFMRSSNQNKIMRWLFPTPLVRFLSLAKVRFRQEQQRLHEFYEELLNKASEMDDYEAGLLVFAQGKNILANDKVLVRTYNKLEKSVSKVEAEKNRIK